MSNLETLADAIHDAVVTVVVGYGYVNPAREPC